jgi:probable rRNA maturation factor
MAPDEDSRRRLRVLVADERGRSLRAGALGSWLCRVAPAAARGTVSIALVSDTRIRALNRTYRHKDYATDVLSFPGDRAGLTRSPRLAPSLKVRTTVALRDGDRRTAVASAEAGQVCQPGEGGATRESPVGSFLGDIVIARGVATRQARQAGHSEAIELRVLALHGLLHLLGYDHEHDGGTMRRVEQRLQRKGGLRESLIERATPARGRGRQRAGGRPVKRS